MLSIVIAAYPELLVAVRFDKVSTLSICRLHSPVMVILAFPSSINLAASSNSLFLSSFQSSELAGKAVILFISCSTAGLFLSDSSSPDMVTLPLESLDRDHLSR